MNDVRLVSNGSSSVMCRAVCELYQNNTALRPDLTVNSVGKRARDNRDQKDTASIGSLKKTYRMTMTPRWERKVAANDLNPC